MTDSRALKRVKHRDWNSIVMDNIRASSLVLLMAFILCTSVAFVAWGPSSILDRWGRVVMVEIVALLFMSVLPVVWRYRAVGLKALAEPLCFMSGAILVYYVLRGYVLLFRDSVGHHDNMLLSNPATHADLALSLGYIIVGLCSFHLAYRFWCPPLAKSRQAIMWSSSSLRPIVILGVCAASVSTLILIKLAGGFGSMVTHFGCLRETTTGYGYLLLGLPYWGIVFAFALSDRLHRRKNILLPFVLLFISNITDSFMGNRAGVLAIWATALLLSSYAPGGLKLIRFTVLAACTLTATIGFALPMAYVRDNVCYVMPATLAQRATTVIPSTPALPATPAQRATPVLPATPSSVATSVVPPTSSRPASHPVPPASRGISSPPHGISIASANTVGHYVLHGLRAYWTSTDSFALRVSREFVALDSFSTIVAVGREQFPFRFGRTYLDGMLFVIPRAIWPAKPRAFSFAIGQYLVGKSTDIPPGYIGELYINFHLPGIIAGMYLLGLLLRAAHKWLVNGYPIAITAYAVLIPYFIIFMGRSFIGGGTMTLIQLGLMLPVIWILRRTRPIAANSMPSTSSPEAFAYLRSQ